jgi:hypothetical protein
MIVASVFMYSATSRKGRGETKDAAQDVPGRVPLREWLPAALLGMLFCGINQCGANLPSYLKGGTDFSGAFRTMAIYAGLLAAALAHVALNRLRGRTAARARDEIPGVCLAPCQFFEQPGPVHIFALHVPDDSRASAASPAQRAKA